MVRRDGVEPPQSETGGLQPLGLASAQPTQREEEVGFEPTEPGSPARRFSRPEQSTALPLFHAGSCR